MDNELKSIKDLIEKYINKKDLDEFIVNIYEGYDKKIVDIIIR